MKRKLGWVLLMGLPIGLMFQNCSPAQMEFTGPVDLSSQEAPAPNPDEDPSSTPTDPVTPDDSGPQIVNKQKSFDSASKEKMVDMVWVIDNSTSMKEEADIIRRNFKAFAASVGSKANLKVALITRRDTFSLKTHVALPPELTNGTQVDFLVHSYNPLLVAASAICPETPDNDDVFCTKNRMDSRYNNVHGSLNSFFREKSQKVFVFVTDDDSAYRNSATVQYQTSQDGFESKKRPLEENADFITPSTFKDRVARKFGANASYKVFGFLSLPQISGCGYGVSLAYMGLVSDMQGSYYDICQTDWTNNFKALSESVIEYASNEYSLESANLHAITSVHLNGRMLIPELEYTVQKDNVILKKELVASAGDYKITVVYQEIK